MSTAAMMGRADHVRYLLPNQIHTRESPILANRMDLREGQQTTNVQRLGRAADTLHNALCQSVPAAPGKEPVIRVFPAWPKEWDAAFILLTRGAFLVGSSMKAGEIEYVRIESNLSGSNRRLAASVACAIPGRVRRSRLSATATKHKTCPATC
jgi:hypothetical protein